jgi:hypothetical protein
VPYSCFNVFSQTCCKIEYIEIECCIFSDLSLTHRCPLQEYLRLWEVAREAFIHSDGAQIDWSSGVRWWRLRLIEGLVRWAAVWIEKGCGNFVLSGTFTTGKNQGAIG